MSFGPAVQKFDGVPVTAEEELRMTRRVACFAIGEDVLLIWDDVFDARQKRHESGICEHGRLHQAGSPSVAVRKVLEAGVIQVDICGSFEGVLDFLRLLEQHVKRTTAPARHGLGFLSNDDRQPMGDRFVKVAKKGNEEDAIRVPPATDLNKGLMDIIEHQRFVQRHCPGHASELEEIDRIAQLEGVAVDSGGCKRNLMTASSKALGFSSRHSSGCSSDNAVRVALSTSEKIGPYWKGGTLYPFQASAPIPTRISREPPFPKKSRKSPKNQTLAGEGRLPLMTLRQQHRGTRLRHNLTYEH